jgi:two-component system, chemotaxis family, chemotaxis protein CheY
MSYCLIVDSNPEHMLVVKQMVEKLGFEIQLSTNIESALAICKETMPKAIILDWNLPDGDVISFIEKLKKTTYFARTSIIVCSGDASKEKVVKAVDAGAKGYITKPLQIDSLAKQFARLGLIRSDFKYSA